VRAKRASDSRFAREARPVAASSDGPQEINKRIELHGIEIPKIFGRARFARSALRPLLAGSPGR
jgi:hypothetical protein